MTKKRMRSLVPALVLSLAVGSLAGCGSKPAATDTTAAQGGAADTTTTAASTDGGTATASTKDTLIIATANETPSLTTNLHNATAGSYINMMTHNGLFDTADDLTTVPALCEDYEILSDTEWIFHLRKGVKFHNGMEMTAKDVKASLELCKESPQVSQYSKSTGTIDIIDDYTIKITTDGPQSVLLTDLCHHGNAILPAELIESGHDFNKEPIGTGPYKVVAWNKGESIELEAFEDYWGGAPAIKHVIWKIIPEGSSRTMALETGEVDLLIEVETTDIARLEENPDIVVRNQAGTCHNWMMINTENAPFNNKDFRLALASAIDKEAVIQVALNGNASVSNCMLPDCFPGVSAEGAPTFDTEKAKEYMAASGLNPADCGFSIICSDDAKLRMGQVIQSCLKETLGIDVTLESMDLATYLDQTATGDYQAAIGNYTSSNLLAFAQGVYHSMSVNGSNKTRTNDPTIDALINKLQATLDPEENVKAAAELSLAINELCPQVPLFLRNDIRAYNAKLQGFNMTASGDTHIERYYWGN